MEPFLIEYGNFYVSIPLEIIFAGILIILLMLTIFLCALFSFLKKNEAAQGVALLAIIFLISVWIFSYIMKGFVGDLGDGNPDKIILVALGLLQASLILMALILAFGNFFGYKQIKEAAVKEARKVTKEVAYPAAREETLNAWQEVTEKIFLRADEILSKPSTEIDDINDTPEKKPKSFDEKE